jgi:WD40 repeat protein
MTAYKIQRTLLRDKSDTIRSVAFSPDGKTCVLGSLDGGIELWNPHIGQFLRAFASQEGGGSALAFSQDGQLLATGTGRFLQLLNPLTGQSLRSFSSQSNVIKSLAFSPDGQALAIGGDKGIELWEPKTGNLLCTLTGHKETVWSVTFSSDGRGLLSGSQDKTIKLWRPVP